MQNDTICPICQKENNCTVHTDPTACWCMTIEITDEQRKQLPAMTHCICNGCLQKMLALNESL